MAKSKIRIYNDKYYINNVRGVICLLIAISIWKEESIRQSG